MTLTRFFPIWLHAALAAGMIGYAAGLRHTVPLEIVKAYTATGFAVGAGVTAVCRFLFWLGTTD